MSENIFGRSVSNFFFISEVGFAHPLGMQSGKIKASQLTFSTPPTTSDPSLVRLFGPTGWKPVSATQIFLEVTFRRRRKLLYFIIQDSNAQGRNFSQSFRLSYKNTVSDPLVDYGKVCITNTDWVLKLQTGNLGLWGCSPCPSRQGHKSTYIYGLSLTLTRYCVTDT